MAAPSPVAKPKGSPGRSLGARLGRKVGPLPVWAWAAVILGAYLLYSRLHPGAATSGGTTALTASTDPGSTTGGDTSGGVGSAGTDLSAITAQLGANQDAQNQAQDAQSQALGALGSSVDALTWQIMRTTPDPAGANGAPPGAGSSSGAASTPTPPPAQAAAAAGHLTQTTAGSLQWGGLTFTTKAAFNSWAKSHRTSATKEFAAHPQAKALYSTLR